MCRSNAVIACESNLGGKIASHRARRCLRNAATERIAGINPIANKWTAVEVRRGHCQGDRCRDSFPGRGAFNRPFRGCVTVVNLVLRRFRDVVSSVRSHSLIVLLRRNRLCCDASLARLHEVEADCPVLATSNSAGCTLEKRFGTCTPPASMFRRRCSNGMHRERCVATRCVSTMVGQVCETRLVPVRVGFRGFA